MENRRAAKLNSSHCTLLVQHFRLENELEGRGFSETMKERRRPIKVDGWRRKGGIE